MFGSDEICLDQILVMKQQEETSYKCDNYLEVKSPSLSQECSCKAPLHLQHEALEESPTSVFDMLSIFIPTFERKERKQDLHSCPKDDVAYQSKISRLISWRTEMIKWSYRVVDAYGFSHTSVAIAFSNLDRYICTFPQHQRSSITRQDFVLMSITCLYISIKIFEAKRKLSIFAFQEMSQYAYSAESFRRMESEILTALKWKVNPPVAKSYIIPLLQLLNKRLLEISPNAQQSGCMDQNQQRCILFDSSNLVNISLSDSALVSKRPSSIAIAAILISWLEGQFYHTEDDKPKVSTQIYCNEMKDLLNINIDCDEVEFVYNRLKKIHRQLSP